MSDCTTIFPGNLPAEATTSMLPGEFDNGLGDPSMSVDFDGDGWAETVVSDLNADGIADMYDYVDPYTGVEAIAIDSDLDGMLDTAAFDDDGDGDLDVVAMDIDGDGEFETQLDPAAGHAMAVPFDPALEPGIVSADDDLDPDVHGEPMAEIPYHQAQVGPNDCLPTSVAMVLTETTGVDVPQAELVDLANELNLLGPDGMSLDGGVTLLEHYGVEAEVQTGTIDDLRTLLDNGTPVIIGLDADDLYGLGDQPFADDLNSGHAVVITGIDDEAGLVYINDPGFPDGAGVAVPLSEFEDAWADGSNSMIVAEIESGFDSGNGSDTEPGTDGRGVIDPAASGAARARADELSLIDLVLISVRLVLN